MNFAGHWIPMRLANSLLILWGIAVLVLVVAVFIFKRSRQPRKNDSTERSRAPRRRSLVRKQKKRA